MAWCLFLGYLLNGISVGLRLAIALGAGFQRVAVDNFVYLCGNFAGWVDDHATTKHFRFAQGFIRSLVDDGILRYLQVASRVLAANIFGTSLQKAQFRRKLSSSADLRSWSLRPLQWI